LYIFGLIFISCILNAFKLFQYRINYPLDSLWNNGFPFEIRDDIYCAAESHRFHCKLFTVFKIANRSLNDVLFVILNVFIDIVLLKRFKSHMDNKMKQISDSKQHKLIEKSKKNVNRMIFVNSLIYLFSHLPEFTTTLWLIVYSRKMSNFCQNKFSCDLLNEEAEFFGLISIVCQFYVFKMFDKNFKWSFNDLKSKLFFCLFSIKKNRTHN